MELLEQEKEKLEKESAALWEDFRNKGRLQLANLLSVDPNKVEITFYGKRIDFDIKRDERWDFTFHISREKYYRSDKYKNELHISSFDCDLFSEEYETMSNLINLIKEKYGDILKIMETPEEIKTLRAKIDEVDLAIDDLKKANFERIKENVREKINKILKLVREKQLSISLGGNDYKDIKGIHDNSFEAIYWTTQKTWSKHPKEINIDNRVYSIARNIRDNFNTQCNITIYDKNGFYNKGHFGNLDECIKELENMK